MKNKFKIYIACFVLVSLAYISYALAQNVASNDSGLAQNASLIKPNEAEVLEVVSPETSVEPSAVSIDRSSLPWKGSFMFKDDEVNQIYASVSDTTPIASEEENNDGLVAVNASANAVEEDEQKAVEMPAFFLNSIMFYHSKNWALWINGKKIRYGEEDPSLKIIKVGMDNAEVEWCSEMLDLILQPGWNQQFYKLSQDAAPLNPNTMDSAEIAAQRKARYEKCKAGKYQWNYVSKDGRIFVDTRTGSVKFNLDLHQSFVSKDMKVTEGKVEGTVTDSESANEAQTASMEGGGTIQNIAGRATDAAGKIAETVGIGSSSTEAEAQRIFSDTNAASSTNAAETASVTPATNAAATPTENVQQNQAGGAGATAPTPALAPAVAKPPEKPAKGAAANPAPQAPATIEEAADAAFN